MCNPLLAYYAKNISVLEDTDIVKQKIDELCLAINHQKVQVKSVIIGRYRISFSLAFTRVLAAIDNRLPIDNEQCRVRILYYLANNVNNIVAGHFTNLQQRNNTQVKIIFPNL